LNLSLSLIYLSGFNLSKKSLTMIYSVKNYHLTSVQFSKTKFVLLSPDSFHILSPKSFLVNIFLMFILKNFW